MKKIEIRKDCDTPRVQIHEMLHAASTKIDDKGKVERVGVKVEADGQWSGAGINEGTTEYFTQRLLKGKTEFVAYKELVSLTKDLVNLYGEENIFDAYLNSPNKLVALMEKDGQDYRDLLQMTDSYYKEVYDNELPFWEACKQDGAKVEAEKITQFIEKIRENRLKENPRVVLPEGEWKKTYNEMVGIKEKEEQPKEQPMVDIEEKVEQPKNGVGTWFKNLFSKIKEKLSPKEKQLLLESGEQQNNFRDSLKQENFKSEFEQPSIQRIQQENIKNERKNNLNIENER